jgi:preprotein translocase subunit SecB
MIQLGLKLEKEEEHPAPHYTYHIELIGVFSLAEEFKHKDPDTFVKVNGAAVLYGAAREMIANLTARGPYDALELLTVTFVDEADATDRKTCQ